MRYGLVILPVKEVEKFQNSEAYKLHKEEIICFECNEKPAKLMSKLGIWNTEESNRKKELLSNKSGTPEEKFKYLEIKITQVIQEFGIPANIKGYGYLRSAIIITVQNGKIPSVTKELYPKVAKMYNTTSSRVERAIRHAIEVAWKRGNQEIIEETFGYSIAPDKGKPTNAQMIATIAEKVKSQIEIL